MRAFYLAWSGAKKKLPQSVAESRRMKKLPQLVADLPWGHNVVLLEKLDKADDRLWYAKRVNEEGWSRATLQA